ncbi:putative DNA-binding protein [uncultured delta proteobacterium]|uniref:Putative DNA-binding protein n=1 Tax=uncultured delta proteobacterium TaxID=34034 RepID=A0A212K279_9DELT|nr:putative DNA-binding protein [uncultured delta proteobacterium]
MSHKETTIAFEEQLQRIHCSLQTRTQTELAEFLDIRQSSVSDAKKRQSVPAEWLLKLLRLKGVNPEWILTGHGPRLLRPVEADDKAEKPEPAASPAPARQLENLPMHRCTMDELMAEVVRRAVKSMR